MASDSPGIPESVVAQIWQRQLVKKKALVTSDGQLVEVIYPGRANRSGGPDFRGAIIAIRDEFLRGDVEVHLRSSGWQAHGHDRNPAFSGVILHVVMWDDTPCSRRPREGKPIPILPLYRCLQAPLEKILWKVAQPPVSNDPCAGVRHRLGGESLERVLDDLGEARFRDKVARFRDGLSIGEAGQVLYEGLMEALGYSKNKEAFRELAQRLPLRAMEGLVRDQGPEARDLILQALLLGTAGFLRTPRHGPGAAPLRKAWSSLGGGACMAETSWHFTAVRPGNHPTRRLEAARALILRFLDGGLVEGILGLIREAQPPSGHRKLESGLMVSGPGGALLGRGRAAEMAVNIVLPFFYAFGEFTGQREEAERALALYRSYPRLGENETTRFMSGQLLAEESPPGLSNSARRQQGLIQLYRRYCQERRCGECPLGKAGAGSPQPSLSPGSTSRSQPETLPALI